MTKKFSVLLLFALVVWGVSPAHAGARVHSGFVLGKYELDGPTGHQTYTANYGAVQVGATFIKGDFYLDVAGSQSVNTDINYDDDFLSSSIVIGSLDRQEASLTLGGYAGRFGMFSGFRVGQSRFNDQIDTRFLSGGPYLGISVAMLNGVSNKIVGNLAGSLLLARWQGLLNGSPDDISSDLSFGASASLSYTHYFEVIRNLSVSLEADARIINPHFNVTTFDAFGSPQDVNYTVTEKMMYLGLNVAYTY